MKASEASQPAVRTENLSRHYGRGHTVIRAVDGVTLEMGRGDFVALLGSSGSGKSTLLNLIAGLDRATTGAVFVDGQDLAQMTPDQLARYRRHRVGMVFQSFNLIPSMTLQENVELPMRLAEVPREERRARVAEALDRVGLSARLQHRPAELSGGEQQRGALARALVNQPTILLADEPTGNLDSRTGQEVLKLIAEVNTTLRTTVLLVTHERGLAEQFAHRLLTISDGKLLAEEVRP